MLKNNHHQNTNGHNTNITKKYDDITYVQNLMNAKRHIFQIFLMAQLPFTLHEDHGQIVTRK
jgi:hypothetical protein